MMVSKTLAAYKRPALIAVVVLGVAVIVNWAARADPSHSKPLFVAQGDEHVAGDNSASPAPAGSEHESETKEKQESAGPKQKPLEAFEPSEKIEAEQEVDFPYDI